MSAEDPEQCLLIGGEPIKFDPADHELKVWSQYFWAIGEGKEFELRKDDRDYKVGDLVRLREYLQPPVLAYTGVQIDRRISFILRGPEAEQFGLKPGYCILGLAKPNEKIRPDPMSMATAHAAIDAEVDAMTDEQVVEALLQPSPLPETARPVATHPDAQEDT